MDFHSLTRRELQSLCKLNKIPANITNVAMADALQALEIVEGIEEILNPKQSETTDSVEITEKVEILSPKAPQTRCRTSTRQKVKITETENLPPTATRTTRRASKQAIGGTEETKNDILNTPAISTTRRRAPATSSRRNVNKQLNECENEAKKESVVPKTNGRRASSRLTEKKSAENKLKKESENVVKIDSFLDEVNVTSEEVAENNTLESGKPTAEVEDICIAFEKLDVEKEDSGEVETLKQESDETLNTCEIGKLEEKIMIEENVDMEEIDESEVNNDESEVKIDESEVKNDESEVKNDESEVKHDDSEVKNDESEVKNDDNSIPCEDEELEVNSNSVDLQSGAEETTFVTENTPELGQQDMLCADLEINGCLNMESGGPIESLESKIENNFNTEDMKEVSENTVDVIMANEIQDKNVIFDKADEESIIPTEIENPLILNENVISHQPPLKNTSSSLNVSDDKENMKEKDLTEISLRQLRKQFKIMTLKSIKDAATTNKDEEGGPTATTRPALQALCENQLVVGETKDFN